jgi:hypothetical protein
MNESQPEQPRPGLWGYPAKWVREESFWREMTTRTLSEIDLSAALLAAAVIFLGARSAGLFHQVPWSTVGKAFVAGSAWIGVASVIITAMSVVQAWRASRKNVRARKHVRDMSHQVGEIVDSMDAHVAKVGEIVDSMDAHAAKQREWEAQQAELDRQYREAVDEARRAHQAREDANDDDDQREERQ